MDGPAYDIEEAARVAHESISPILQEKFTEEDILEILLVMQDFYTLVGINTEEETICEYPIDYDHEEMKYFIIHNCVEKDLILADDELEDILEGEFKYLEQNGFIVPGGGLEHLN